MPTTMTAEQFHNFMDSDMDFRTKYSEFIMNNCGGDRMICNGDMLIEAEEDGYLLQEFAASVGVKGGI